MGFRRLSIIDVEHAKQPITNEDETLVLICNGEIYNYKELREELQTRGHQFKTNGDAETILHLFEEYGVDCVDHLRGMFAFMIWDMKTETLFAARDHFGIKPFYYFYNDEKIVCSSELKSIAQEMGSLKELDPQSMLHYLTFQYVPDPRTMIKGVSKLLPAHRLIVQGNEVKVERYWQPTFEEEEQSEKEMRKNILETMEESVQLHMQSDVPTGCFLSSGIDSTAIRISHAKAWTA
ncbi:asparagine synthetase B family protein [Salipaludibacillus sp. CF4.18]|uniref:asparagine synthetase B family protein n=1 Tax=Salipaludibacillus sp. CF4.18 TaxID=3373081 RepID=UPI003EE45C6B